MNFTEKASGIWAKMKGISKWWWIIGGVVLVIIILVTFGGGGNGATETYTVTRSDVRDEITVSGKTEESDSADLGFAIGGRVGRVFVKEGQKVYQGQLLAQLEIGDLVADLAIKRAQTAGSKETLDQTILEQDQLVSNAYRKLLSDDLEAVPIRDDDMGEPPVITGTYNGDAGEYVLNMYASNAASGASIRYSGLETGTTTVSSAIAYPLGTKGLYIKFSADERYSGTKWVIEIPNKRSDSYSANLSAYESAKRTRDLAVARAEADYTSAVGDNASQAEIAKIQSDIRKASIYAPFAGVVSNIESVEGETIATGATMLSVVGERSLRVNIQIPEIDVSSIVSGLPVTLKLDAFPGETFKGIIDVVNVRDTIVDGVPVYEGSVSFETPPVQIKTGMTAYATILVREATQVLAIPKRFITIRDGKSFVTVLSDGKQKEVEIVTGIEGSDSMVEVLSGINEGDVIETPK